MEDKSKCYRSEGAGDHRKGTKRAKKRGLQMAELHSPTRIRASSQGTHGA